MHFRYLPWPTQSPDMNIFEQLWSVLESMVRSRFPPPSLNQLQDVFHDSVPLEPLHSLHEFIPRRIHTVLQAKSDPTPY
jgi:hypothetical protein